MSSTPAIRPLPGTAPRARQEQQVLGDGWRITVLTEGLFRVERWSVDAGAATDARAATHARAATDARTAVDADTAAAAAAGLEDRASSFAIRRDLPAVPFTTERVGSGVVVTTDRARVRYDGGPLTANGFVVETIGQDAQRWRYGEPTHDLGGTARTLDDVDGRTELEPGVVAADGITVIDDSDSFLFEDDGWLGERRPGGTDLYVFAHGRDHEAAVRALYTVSGPPMRLPRWALGNWWSRYHPYSSESYLALMDRFRAERLPFSVAVIDMDWHRVDSVPPEYGNGWTGYSWEPSLIPDPAAFLGELHERGMRTTLNLHPADGVRAFEDRYPEMARAVGIDPSSGEAVSFRAADRTFLEAYFRELHHPLEEQGVDFWWIDWQQGSTSDIAGVDPLWVLNHFHHLDAARDGGSGMTFSRYAGPGSHRYAVGFSGDAVVSWDSLAFQPEFTAAAANIGYGWWSHDIGGHTRGVHDEELATRWVQFGVFSPIMRLHSANNPFIRKEPWVFPAEHRSAMDEALRLRHRMVPYLHTMNHRASSEGIPLVRPMYHRWSRDREAYGVPNEYEFGSELVVAPITAPRDPASRRGSVRVWLPAGTWTDVVTGTAYRGGRSITMHRTIDSVPVLLRAGGILPLDATSELDATVNPSSLEVLVAPAADGSLVLVEDAEDGPAGAAAASGDAGSAASDGAGSTASGPADGSGVGREARADSDTHAPVDETDRSARTELSWDASRGEFRIAPASGAVEAVPVTRTWTIVFLAALPSGPVTVDGSAVSVAGVDGRWSVEASVARGAGAVVQVGPLRVGVDPLPAMQTVLEEAQMGNPEKLEAWEVLTSGRTTTERLAELGAVAMPESVRTALVELLGSVDAA